MSLAPSTQRRLARIHVAAQHVDCSPVTLRRRIYDGTIKGYRFGPRLLMVDLDEVEAAMRPVMAG